MWPSDGISWYMNWMACWTFPKHYLVQKLFLQRHYCARIGSLWITTLVRHLRQKKWARQAMLSVRSLIFGTLPFCVFSFIIIIPYDDHVHLPSVYDVGNGMAASTTIYRRRCFNMPTKTACMSRYSLSFYHIIAARSPKDPQWWLAGSVHPYAPFVGNALKWESYVYDDGSTYEGTMLLDVPHGKGTIIFGNGFGGGIQRPEKNDKYEGEFDTGFAHGLAQYTHTSKGKLFKGEYNIGQRHGCGAEYDMNPFLKKVKGGIDPNTAWEETKDTIESKAKYGTWLRDAFFTGPDESGRWCHIKEIKGTIQEVDEVVNKVKMFQYKPDGEVTIRLHAMQKVSQPHLCRILFITHMDLLSLHQVHWVCATVFQMTQNSRMP